MLIFHRFSKNIPVRRFRRIGKMYRQKGTLPAVQGFFLLFKLSEKIITVFLSPEA